MIALPPQGAADAEKIGRDRLHPPYAAFVSTGVARATQMLEILRRAAGQDDMPITRAAGLRLPVEDRWCEAAKAAGKAADLDAIRDIDPDLVERESLLLASALQEVAEGLPDGPAAGGGPQPHQRGRSARTRRPGRSVAGKGKGGPADRRRRRPPGEPLE